MKHLIINITLFIATIGLSNSQESKKSELFLALKKQDSIFFERGFNQCDTTYLEGAVAPGLMFYHDKSGIQNREKFFENTKKYICPASGKKPIRKVEEQSLEVFAMYDNNVLYGAIQTGTHNFYIREAGKDDVLTGKARFIHLYLLENGKWLLKEVLSFEHQEAR
jgi:hypothetical protein